MKEAINQLAQALTGKEHIGNCTEEELRQMARLYPFFGPAHVLLAKKLKGSGAEEEIMLTQKASLYLHNPLWFGELMNETGITERDSAFADIVTTETAAHDTVLEVPVTEEEVVVQLKDPVETDLAPIPDFAEDTILETPATTEEVVEQVNEPIASAEINQIEEIEETEEKEETIHLPIFPSLKIEPLDASKMELSFEPYHTVDYFASQGIRFKEEEKPKDRLSHQLKSFTEWLKTLKKLPPSEIPETATRQEEKKVEQLAQVSITDREVLTEAMAEVWEMQGNAVKAVELYEKLSLLDPSKSSYFAAKIEHLKQL